MVFFKEHQATFVLLCSFRYWLYGDKVLPDQKDGDPSSFAAASDRVRGWFPRRCAVDFVDNSVPPSSADKQPSSGAAASTAAAEADVAGDSRHVSGLRKRQGDKKRK